ncbi:hypothetical protein K431DRAFT_288326 [Polychaeton citri CBS 116435]|uniref:Kinetochore protein SPC25 n=1 Tax=Polychaeton citri CBS 116435 TaxID=1314669 RepID=A0A9P4Q1F1_9PEZI|nr:hypothetical protein K431DRAFT_288326 [Polychaeton citri CBS 116435]
MTPNRFGTTWSGGQQNGYPANAVSMADTLPEIDFNFNDLRERMARFTTRFDEFIERGRKRVLEERNSFRIGVTELQDSQSKRRHAIAELEGRCDEHADTLAKEAQETQEMRDAIASLEQQRGEQRARRDGLRAEIESVQYSVRQRREAQATFQRSLDAQARHNAPELRFWEQCLGLRIEGAGGDRLRFVFRCVDGRDPERECWFELDTGGRECRVPDSMPKLDREDVDGALEKMQAGEFSKFLKLMRLLFVEVCRG